MAMDQEIIFKYYFTENHQVLKCGVRYNELIIKLGLHNKKDNKGQLYSKGHTYQLQKIQMLLLKTKELNIIKCNVYCQGQIIL